MSEIEEARLSLKAATHDAEIISDGLIKSSEKISKLATATLYGLLGGIIGMGLGALIPETQTLSQTACVSLSALAGMVLGVLLYRSGSGGIQIEQKIAVNRLLSSEVMSRIKEAKEANAPEYIMVELWAEFQEVAVKLNSSSTVVKVNNVAGGVALPSQENRSLPSP